MTTKTDIFSKLNFPEDSPQQKANRENFSGLYVRPENADDLPELFKESVEAVDGECYVLPTKTALLEKLESVWKELGTPKTVAYESFVKEILNKITVPFEDTKEAVLSADLAITGAEFLIARLGTVLVSSSQTKSRRIIAFPETHLVIATENQVLYDLPEALEKIQEKYKTNFPAIISLITGPSRTADIEKTLILGAHGPKKLIVLIYKESE